MVEKIFRQTHSRSDFTDRRACWVLWDPDERVVEFRKTEYSRLQAELDMMRAGLTVDAAG